MKEKEEEKKEAEKEGRVGKIWRKEKKQTEGLDKKLRRFLDNPSSRTGYTKMLHRRERKRS